MTLNNDYKTAGIKYKEKKHSRQETSYDFKAVYFNEKRLL